MSDVELFTTGQGRRHGERCLVPSDLVTIRVGSEVRTMTAGEWSRLLATPQRVERAS